MQAVLGENFFPLLVLAFGAGLAGGTFLGLFNKQRQAEVANQEPTRLGPVTLSPKTATYVRSGFFIAAGLVMTAWALASLN